MAPGAPGHRKGRERIEHLYDAAKRRFEALGDEQLDRELATGNP
jgi:hypothetical protein